MTNQITIEEALGLVSFTQDGDGEWEVNDVFYDVRGSVRGSVFGSINRNVHGTVKGDIKSDEWQRVESPQQKLKRLIEVGADKETLLQAVYQLQGQLMTENHPLTDEIVLGDRSVTEMRAAADWQLEQVIEWISENLGIIDNDPRWGSIPRYLKNTCHEECAEVDEWKIISDLKKAMRPQQQLEDN